MYFCIDNLSNVKTLLWDYHLPYLVIDISYLNELSPIALNS
jgi:hypothetical protein